MVEELFFCHKNCFPGKREFYLCYYKAIFKDHILFKLTQPSNKIDVTVVKKHLYGSEYARVTQGSKYASIWLCMSEQDVNMPEYI